MAIWSENQGFWHERAAETRLRAAKTRDQATREDLLKIAEACERLAELAGKTPHSDALKPLARMMAE